MSKGFLNELRQRNVIKVALGYLIAAWLVAQVSDLVLESFDAPDWAMRYLLTALAIGFPVALVISWVFEWTPRGVLLESQVDRTVKLGQQDSGRRLDISILLILAILVIFMGLERFLFSGRDGGMTVAEQRELEQSAKAGRVQDASTVPAPQPPKAPYLPAQKSVAVLPFAVMSTGPDDEYFSDGLTEEIINSLSQLPALMVTARTSAFFFKGQNLPVGEIADKLGVDHIVEGSIRRAGDQLRITAQLIRADDGFHLWSETYDRRTEDTFAVQDDIAQQVARALNIVLDDEQLQRMRASGVRNVDAFIAFQKGIEYYERAHAEPNQISLLRQANRHFEEAIRHQPLFSDAYIGHSDLYSHILISTANGSLDGEITPEDIATAPELLRSDLDNSIRYAHNDGERFAGEFDRAFLLGQWRDLNTLVERALTTEGCNTALWIQLGASAFGNAELSRQKFEHNVSCDPLTLRSYVHLVMSLFWLGQIEQAQQVALSSLQRNHHPWEARLLAMGYAQQGDHSRALSEAEQRIRSEDDRMYALAVLAAMKGDIASADSLEASLTGKYGPNDQNSLVLAAMLGKRNESNRLAAQLDARPFGYISLMQVVYSCLCGAPFDLEATPVFASMLAGSGLPWPPAHPVNYPLKDW